MWRDVAIHKPLIDHRFLDCHASLAMTKRTWADSHKDTKINPSRIDI
jgi:hypothetical protein